MGIAAYYRGNKLISMQLKKTTDPALDIMRRVNGMPKFRQERIGVKRTMKNAIAYFDRGVWFLADANDKYGYCLWYPSLSELVRSWDMSLIEYNYTTDEWSLGE